MTVGAGFVAELKKQTFICSHTFQTTKHTITSLRFWLQSSYVISQPGSHFSVVWAWHCELSFHSLCKCAVFCSTQRCRGFAFMCLCVCFCLHPCFTQDYDCNDVEGKLHNILLTLCLSLYTSVCQPFTYSVAISSWSCLNPLEICVQSQYFKERACIFKQVLCAFWLLVCIHKLLFLLSDSTPSWTYNCFSLSSYHLSTDTQLHIDPTPYILPLHIYHHGSNPH